MRHAAPLIALGLLVLTMLGAIFAPTWEVCVRCCAFGMGLILGSYLQVSSQHDDKDD